MSLNRLGRGGRGDIGPLRGPGRDMFRGKPMLDDVLRRDPLAGRDPFMRPDPLMDAFDPLALQAQVIVLDPERRCRDYAEMFLSKLKRIGLICEIVILDEFTSPSQVIDDATAQGLLYTASVTVQNEIHGSITINILQGQPQEHRNMPFEDALKLVARSFDAHLLRLDSKAGPAPAAGPVEADAVEEIDPTLSLLLINLAEGKSLRLKELDKVIEFLREKRSKLVSKEEVPQKIETVDSTGPAPTPVQPPSSSGSASTQQAEDLQAKITQLFGDRNKQQSTVGVKPAASPSASRYPSSNQAYSSLKAQQSDQQKKKVGIDFNNPTVKNALQNLMKTGPNILDSIRNTSASSSTHNSIRTLSSSSYERASGDGPYDGRPIESNYSSKDRYAAVSPEAESRDESYAESGRTAKRAKPGRHAIAGFY